MHHPEVGTLELNFEVLAQPDDSGHRILMYAADEGSPAASGLRLLATSAEVPPVNERGVTPCSVQGDQPA